MQAQDEARYQAILQTLAQIPKGKVCTYGIIAEKAGYKGHARLVGYVLRNLEPETRIPWHRVINASGRSSFPPHGEKYQAQIARLQDEGITFLNVRVQLSTFLWS